MKNPIERRDFIKKASAAGLGAMAMSRARPLFAFGGMPSEKMVVATYAKRFAAKEACSKALGTGIRQGVWWRDMGVVNMPSGRPTMALTGGARKRLDALTPKGYAAQIDLSITDEGPMSMAFVVISAVAIQKKQRKSAAGKSKTKRGKTVARRR